MAFILFKPLGRLIALAVAVVVVAVVWFVLQVYPISSPGREVFVTVQPGDSLAAIAGEMHAAGVIASPLAFRIDTLLFGSLTVQHGTYGLAQHSSFAAVKAVLSAPPNVAVVSPGLTLREVALGLPAFVGATFADSFLQDANALAAHSAYRPSGSLEGLIGAGDYIIAPGETPMTLATDMMTSFEKVAASVGLTPSTTIEGLNAYQLIIAASIVEKEGYYPSNMPKVARVIFNRLARHGALQMDSTVLYYLQKDGGTVTPAMLAVQTPYNTYLNPGLTPTPICTVSTYSLDAILHAPPGSWYYFTLVNKNGNEAFSTTFAHQLKMEKLAQSRGLG